MDTGDELRKQVDADPSDFQLRLVYSDWLEGEGLYKEAQVQRWIAHKRATPDPSQSFSPDMYSPGYDWICGEWVTYGPLIPYQIFGRILPLSRNAQHFYRKAKPKMIAKGELTFVHYAEFETPLGAYTALEQALLSMLHDGIEID